MDVQAHGMIEMPNPPPEILIFEPFIETDEIIVSAKSTDEDGHQLRWKGHSRWVEITVGVVGKRGSMRSLSPSITVKESGDILSLEEKFQGIFFTSFGSHNLIVISFEFFLVTSTSTSHHLIFQF